MAQREMAYCSSHGLAPHHTSFRSVPYQNRVCPRKGEHMGWLVHRRVVVGLGLVLAAVVCGGCAGARVKNVQADRSLTLPRPVRVVIYDFTTAPTDVQVLASPRQEGERVLALSQEQPDLLAEAVADSLATRLVDAIRSLGLPAERVAGAALPEANDLVIEGDFVRVDAGSPVLRVVIGFGVGASELRTRVRIFQVTAQGWQPVQQFETVATGARLPGAAYLQPGGWRCHPGPDPGGRFGVL